VLLPVIVLVLAPVLELKSSTSGIACGKIVIQQSHYYSAQW
jgi:hypothetical protein